MIEYQKKFNKKLSASLRPYVVRDSNKRLHEINSEVNRSFYEMNGPDIKRKSQPW